MRRLTRQVKPTSSSNVTLVNSEIASMKCLHHVPDSNPSSSCSFTEVMRMLCIPPVSPERLTELLLKFISTALLVDLAGR